jgi:predicted transcriptional regulator
MQRRIVVNTFRSYFLCVIMYAITNRGCMMNINELAADLVAMAGSQTEAARLSGVSQANISRLASGQIGSGIRADTAEKIKSAARKLRRKKRAVKNG